MNWSYILKRNADKYPDKECVIGLGKRLTYKQLHWQGAWEYDPVSGTGSVRIRKDGRLAGRIRIKDGDESTFVAKRAEQPDEPIPDPPSYRDKWRRRW